MAPLVKCELGLRPSDARGRTAAILRFPYWACVACVEACVSRGSSPPPEPSSGVDHTDANLQQRHKSFPLFVLPLYTNFHQFFMQCATCTPGNLCASRPRTNSCLSSRFLFLIARCLCHFSIGSNNTGKEEPVSPKLISRQERLF